MEAGRARIGVLGEREFLVVGVALYAGEGTNGGHAVALANRDVPMVMLFCSWLRRFFHIDESRLRVRFCLHQGLDLEAAMRFRSSATDIPLRPIPTLAGRNQMWAFDRSNTSTGVPMGAIRMYGRTAP